MLKIQVEIDSLISEIDNYIRSEVPEERREYVVDMMVRALQSTISYNPVDTGRSRASWVKILEETGGQVPTGWEGGTSDAGAIAQGRSLGEFEHESDQQMDEISATSHVDYINYLEYGTGKMAPRGMVRKALLELRSGIATR